MDPKTKALLHTSGAVLASDDEKYGITEFTVFPPAWTMAMSHQAILNAPTGDKKTLIARLAQLIGKSVAKAVENQILKAYEMDAQSALALIMDAKKSFYSQGPSPYAPAGWDPFKIQDGDFVVSQDAFVHQPSATDVVLSDMQKAMKDAMKKIGAKTNHGGIISLDNPDSIWDLPKGQPVFFQGGQHGHISHIEGATSFAAFDPACKPVSPPDEATYYTETKIFRDLIPGFAKMKQRCPVKTCKATDIEFLQDTIIHLNDHHKWKRERVAEWLETLDHDLTFKTPEEMEALKQEQQTKVEHLKQMIGQPLLPHQENIINELMGEGVKNGNSD